MSEKSEKQCDCPRCVAGRHMDEVGFYGEGGARALMQYVRATCELIIQREGEVRPVVVAVLRPPGVEPRLVPMLCPQFLTSSPGLKNALSGAVTQVLEEGNALACAVVLEAWAYRGKVVSVSFEHPAVGRELHLAPIERIGETARLGEWRVHTEGGGELEGRFVGLLPPTAYVPAGVRAGEC